MKLRIAILIATALSLGGCEWFFITLASEIATPHVPPKITRFDTGAGGITSFWSPDAVHGMLVGPKAFYQSDGDLMHWTAVDSLVGQDNSTIIGGDFDHIYFLGHDQDPNQPVIKQWQRDTGFIRTFPVELTRLQTIAEFVSANRGFYLGHDDAPGEPYLAITLDGGTTWQRSNNLLGNQTTFEFVNWVGPDEILLGGRPRNQPFEIAAFHLDDHGQLQKLWTIPANSSARPLLRNSTAIWLKTANTVRKLEPQSGHELASFDIAKTEHLFAAVGPDFWAAGDLSATIYRPDSAGHYAAARTYHYPVRPQYERIDWIIPEKEAVAIFSAGGQVYRPDGDNEILVAASLAVNNDAVIRNATAAVEQAPTAQQIRDLFWQMRRLTIDQSADLNETAAQKQIENNWTNRQKVAWQIAEARRIADSTLFPPAALPTGNFGGIIFGLRWFSPTSGFAVTNEGVLVTDGSPLKWKGDTRWDHRHGWYGIAGGSDKAMFLYTLDHTDSADAIKLWRWQPGRPLQFLRDLPPKLDDQNTPVCNFFNENVGAFVDATTLHITRDAGNTWVDTPLAMETRNGESPPDHTWQILWCAADKLALTSGPQSIAVLQVDNNGHASELWHANVAGRFPHGTLALNQIRKQLWVFSGDSSGQPDRIQAFNLDDGKRVRDFPATKDHTHLDSFSIEDDRIYELGDGPTGTRFLRILDAAPEIPTLITEIHVDNNAASLDSAYPLPGNKDLYLVLRHDTLIQWDGKPQIPALLPTRIHRPEIKPFPW